MRADHTNKVEARLGRQAQVRAQLLAELFVAVLQAALQLEQRTAYAQRSRSDRYTLWLADGESSIVPRGGDGVLERTLHGDLAATWQQCASALGSPLASAQHFIGSRHGQGQPGGVRGFTGAPAGAAPPEARRKFFSGREICHF